MKDYSMEELEAFREAASNHVSCGPLRWLKEYRVATDGHLVIKRANSKNGAAGYLADLSALAAAGIPAETALHPQPIDDERNWYIIVCFVEGEPAKSTPEALFAVGKLMRQMHDAVWPFTNAPKENEVYCPDDWHPRNVVFVEPDKPVHIDLDLATATKRWRALEYAADEWGEVLYPPVPLLHGYNFDDRFSEHPNYIGLLKSTKAKRSRA